MINHYTEPFAPAAGQLHLCLEDFERADIRVAERHFGPKDIIYAPGDPYGQLHFLFGARCACTRSTASTRKPRSRC
jgi:CRP/FNR family transcriptional regulator, global nitrogen regulator